VTLKPAAHARIPRATLATIVGERIRTSVIDGTLKPGAQLNEVELANSFGVSRGPVREALQRLIQEGLLRSEPHRGVFIPVMTEDDVADIYLAREALEAAAIRRIMTSGMSKATYKKLDRQVTAMEKAEAAGDWEAVGQLDLEFHTALVASVESPRLDRMFRTIMSETRLCLSVLTGVQARADLVAEHRRICDMMRDDDLEGALAAVTRHFDDAVVTLTKWGGEGDEPGQDGAPGLA
jgi:DNA-binding GntR family transcriptional regulator